MAEVAAPPAAAEGQQQQQGSTWMSAIVRMILFQMVMWWLSGRRTPPQPKDPLTGVVIPPLVNSFPHEIDFDFFVHLSPYPLADWDTLRGGGEGFELLWTLPDQKYSYSRWPTTAVERNVTVTLPTDVLDRLLVQHLTAPSGEVLTDDIDDLDPEEDEDEEKLKGKEKEDEEEKAKGGEGNEKREIDMRRKLRKEERRQRRISQRSLLFRSRHDETLQEEYRRQGDKWQMYYLIGTAIPHSAYLERDEEDLSQSILKPFSRSMPMPGQAPGPRAGLLPVSGSIALIDYIEPFSHDDELQSLMGSKANEVERDRTKEELRRLAEEAGQKNVKRPNEAHWKDRVDFRLVYDSTKHTPQTLMQPPLKRFVVAMPQEGMYLPVVYPTDFWLLERDFVLLNDTMKGVPLNLTMSFSVLNNWWFMLQVQMADTWDPDASSTSANPLAALQTRTRRETFMLKRIMLDTNHYFLAFSACFMMLHTFFSFLAFKNEIQFWHKNDSMEGLSAMSVVISFVCEIIVGLYLFDSEETSWLILFEIVMGIAISAWKLTKAVKITYTPHKFPMILSFEDANNYTKSDTKKYDNVAIKFMSILLLPCMVGYAVYALYNKKYKSWYSYVISTLAGTVYTFGFIMMTPQLYINYKLKSVDHLPWRALVYKALNTFVDDVAAFIIDMPLMHRLACFRDDIIFICYLYQRWIYAVDKTRPSEWVDPKEQERLKKEKEEGRQTRDEEGERDEGEGRGEGVEKEEVPRGGDVCATNHQEEEREGQLRRRRDSRQ